MISFLWISVESKTVEIGTDECLPGIQDREGTDDKGAAEQWWDYSVSWLRWWTLHLSKAMKLIAGFMGKSISERGRPFICHIYN